MVGLDQGSSPWMFSAFVQLRADPESSEGLIDIPSGQGTPWDPLGIRTSGPLA